MGLPNMKNQAFDPVLVTMAVCQVTSVVSDFLRPHGLQPARLLCPWDSPGKNPGVGCHVLLQGIFPTQGLSLGFTAPALAAGFFTISTTWEAPWLGNIILKQETLAHGFPGSGMQEWLAGLGGSAQDLLSQSLGGLRGLRLHFHSGSHGWLLAAGSWPEVSVPVHPGLSTGLLGCPHGLGLAPSPVQTIPAMKMEASSLQRPGLRSHSSTLYCILCVAQAHLSQHHRGPH